MSPRLRQAFPAAAVAILALAIFLIRLDIQPFEDYDEATYADVARNVVREVGEPRFAFFRVLVADDESAAVRPWFEKPPLLLWLMAASMGVWGDGEFGARFPSALFGAGCVVLTFLLGRRLGGTGAGLLAAGLLVTNQDFLQHSRDARLDSAVTFFILLAALQFWRWYRGDGRRPLLWAWAAMGCGVLAKSVIGLFPLPLFLAFLLCCDRPALRRFLAPRQHLAGLAAFALVVVPWHVAMTASYGTSFWNVYLGEHVINRATSGILGGQPRTMWYYLRYLWLEHLLLLLVLGLGAGAGLLLRRRMPPAIRRGGLPFVALHATLIIAAFSLARVKLAPYLLPAYPFLALAGSLLWSEVGRALASRSVQARRVLMTSLGVAVAIFAMYSISTQWWLRADAARADHRVLLQEQRDIGRLLAQEPDIPVFLLWYQRAEALQVYGGRPVRFLDRQGEYDIPEPSFLVVPTARVSGVVAASVEQRFIGSQLSLLGFGFSP
ncbi:phospholipid carrier-dependent glycosyltransferase [Patescibacteria group bacterium]|nr:MAG: phospholipid carrier-dependent glycosyltransferase [Patescibacteria group bacterium]